MNGVTDDLDQTQLELTLASVDQIAILIGILLLDQAIVGYVAGTP